MKVNVYIDGFNFYYGAVKGTPHKWLTLREFCEQSLPGCTVHRIKYFTALVNARPGDPDQPVRQETYWRALRTLDRIYVYEGKFRERTKIVPLHPDDPLASKSSSLTFVQALVSEEKGSDVNLATELLCDGFRDDFEAAVIISDDSDLISPILAVRRHLKKQVAVLNPHLEIDPRTGRRRYRKDLQRAVTAGQDATRWFYRHVDVSLLGRCQFPAELEDRNGREILKPQSW